MEERPRMIYTPKEHIPIGEAVQLPNGCHALCIKGKGRKSKAKEIVPLDLLHKMVMEKAPEAEQRSP